MARRVSRGFLALLVMLAVVSAGLILVSNRGSTEVERDETTTTAAVTVPETLPLTTTTSAPPTTTSTPPPPPTRPVVPPPGSPGSDEEPAIFLPELPPDAVQIAAMGDVNLGGTIGELIARSGPGFPWRRVSGLLNAADIAIVNFECSASYRGTPETKQYTFQADPASLPAMREAGIDIASLANNHSLDFGPDALLDTVSRLSAAGVTPLGAGANQDAAWKPTTVDSKGLRITFIAATRVLPPGWAATAGGPGVASAYQERRLLAEVRQARTTSDAVVVAVHWGVERSPDPDPSQVALAHRLVDAGASVVLGHHPHVLQPVVRYRGAVIAYSLGNFVFTAPTVQQESMILRVGILPGGEVALSSVPIRISGGQPRPI